MPPNDFFDRLDTLQHIIRKHAGGSSALREAEALLRDADVKREFFRALDRADWVLPLQAADYFLNPLSAERVEGGGLRYPSWPASRYLARMAPHAPAEVAGIFASIETDNATIIGDMLNAALAMPSDVAVKLVPAVCRAAQAGTLLNHLSDASDLCAKLAEGGEVASAITLADAIFSPQCGDGQEEPTRRDKYWHKEGLKKIVPLLAAQQAGTFMPKLCDWLRAAIDAKKYHDADSDYSYVWRPAIEEHEQNRDHDFAGVMVGFVREGFERAVNAGQMTLDGALQILAQYQHLVFKRIRLHLINVFAEQDPQLARQVMLDPELRQDYQYKHEYAMLVGHRLNLLTPEERDTWFGWIDAGPDMSDFDDSIKSHLQRDATEEDRQNRLRHWRFEKLHWIRKHLDGARKEFYEQMLVQHGEPDMADLSFRVGEVRWGSDSPMTVDDLAAMTFEQAVDRVASWKPDSSRPMGPDIEGLASTFSQYVVSNSGAFSQKAEALIGKPTIYVRHFINKMGEAVKAGLVVDVTAILTLCQWVIDRPLDERTTPAQEHEGLVDKDWQWTRDDISRFIEEICKAKAGEAPQYPLDGLRMVMWQTISVLCRGRSESYVIHDVAEDDPRVRDYLDLGINSPRGKAVGAALEYARWVANHIKETRGQQEVIPGGFEAMPEVRDMLQWQLAAENRTVEALSVIGSRAGLVYRIDKGWLAQAAESLFNLNGIEQSPPVGNGWAAWNAFLVWVRPHIDFYRLFKGQFDYAVKQASLVQLSGDESREQPMYHLGEHLVLLYGRGQLGLDDDGGLLRRFFTTSTPDIRRHAIGFVGQSLEGTEKIPADVVQRFMTLWEFYWANSGSDDAKEKPGAWSFGTLFSSGQFPEQWSLDQMERFVAVDPTPEPDQGIAERLATIARCDIMKAVRILDRMVRGDEEGWRIHGWLDSAKQILETAMNAGGDAHRGAVELINYLGRRGHTAFGALLKK